MLFDSWRDVIKAFRGNFGVAYSRFFSLSLAVTSCYLKTLFQLSSQLFHELLLIQGTVPIFAWMSLRSGSVAKEKYASALMRRHS